MAAISNQKLTSKSEAFNIDAQPSNAFVRNMEQCWVELIAESVYRLWDDHAKWEPDKKRGYTQRRTVMLTEKVKNAPYSDMGMTLGGVKAVTNTMLLLLPPKSAAGTSTGIGDGTGTSQQDEERISEKRGAACFKLPTAVTRLETELRSTPAQQVNDWHFMVSEVAHLQTFMANKCNYLFALSDNGWDHGVQFFEVC